MQIQYIERITIIGAGNVATQLAIAFYSVGKKIVQIYNHSLDHAQALAKKVNANFTDKITLLLPDADIYIIAVSDNAIDEMIALLPRLDSFLVHTSGTTDIKILSKCSSNYGILYPVQTLIKNRETFFDKDKIPFCIEANDEKNLFLLKNLASSISCDVREISSEQRRLIHLSAVFASNFTNHMYFIAQELLKQKNIPIDILEPLIEETAKRVKNKNLQQAQTGPAKRNDSITIQKHLQMLAQYPEYAKIYQFISESIFKHKH